MKISIIVFVCLLAVIPLFLIIFKIVSTKQGDSSKIKTFILAVLSAASAFALGILASYKGYNYLNEHYFLPFWINSILTFLVIVLVLSICGLAINFVTPAKKKELVYAIALTSFLCLGLGIGTNHYRGDFFNPKNGITDKWITPSTGKVWHKKPAKWEYDPATGEKLESLTKDLLKARKAETKISPRQIQEKIVHFKPDQPTNSHLTVQPGDTVWYINPTAPFKVPGQNQFHTIATTTEHEATGFGDIVIYGDKKKGYVQIKIIPINS